MTDNTPQHLADQGAQCIACATSDDGYRERWTNLSVWFLHQPKYGGKRFVARVEGVSNMPGERTRVNELASGTLDRALKIIEGGLMGTTVTENAREWLDDNRVMVADATRGGPIQFDSDREALAWLYGQPVDFKGFPTLLAADLGAGASTVRMQLRDDRDVMVPLRSLLPFIDRAAFRRAMTQEDARG